jgi:hypothetical protein
MKLEKAQCGFFAAITGKHGHNLPIFEILRDIKGGKWAKQIGDLRTLDSEAYNAAKRKLPAFMVSAVTLTGGHAGKDLGQHTGLLQIDIDKLADIQEAEYVKGQLAANPHVLACWISPGGKGVKGIVPISASHDTHKACFEVAKTHFLKTLGREIDASCSDASRLCFVSHDLDLILKQTAEPFLPLEAVQAEADSIPPPVYSSPSLHSRSYILNPPSPSSVLHNTSWKDYPCLEPFYQNLVVERLGDVQPGLRNHALVEMVPVLYSAIAPKFVLLFAERFYELNSSKFHDPLEQHMKEAQALLSGIEADYTHKRLSPQEAAIYSGLEEKMQAAFRICHALSHVEHEDCPPPFIFLSAEKLGHRLGLLTVQADRLLKRLCRLEAMKMTKKGTKRVSKQPAIATRYEWLLPTLRFCEDT